MENFLLPGSGWFEATPLLLSSLLVKSGIIIGVAGTIAFLLRYSSASLRHLVLSSAMASLILLPLLVLLLPQWRLPILPADIDPVHTVDVARIAPAEAATLREPAVAEPSGIKDQPPFIVVVPEAGADIAVQLPSPHVVPFRAEIESAAAATPGLTEAVTVQAAEASFTTYLKSLPWQLILVLTWITGMLFGITRLLLAHAGVRLLVRRSNVIDNEDWRFAVDRYSQLLDIDPSLRLRVSELTSVPMIIGCGRPTLVLPTGYERWTAEKRRIVLLHELAHIKRRDCLTQCLTEIVCAMYWFNPMVWLAARQIRIEREIACDDIVLMTGTRASTYAQTILDTIKTIQQAEWSPVASIAMARKSDLEGRLISILDPDIRRSRLNRATSALAVALMACVAVPVALAVPVRMSTDSATTPEPNADESPAAPHVDEPRAAAVQETSFEYSFEYEFTPDLAINIQTGEKTSVEIARKNESEFSFRFDDNTWSANENINRNQSLNQNDNDRTWRVARNSYRDDFMSTTIDTLTIKQLIRLRQFGVDMEFIEGMKGLGYSSLTVDDLIRLAKYGADPEYVSELTAAGYVRLPVDDLVTFSKYGVDGELIGALRTYGYSDLSADEVVNLSKYGIDGDEIAEFTSAGYRDLTIDELIKLSKYGVDADEIAELAEAGYSDLDIDELIELSKYGIDADEIVEYRSAGYTNLTTRDYIELSRYGVDADDIAELRQVGYANLSVDALVELSKYGVDTDDIEDLSRLGYTNLSVNELVDLSKYGTDVDDVEELAELGYSDLTMEEMILISRYGVDIDEVAELTRAGYRFTIKEMIDMGKYGVDGDDIAELAEVGYTDLSVNDIIDISKYGVDVDDVAELASYGMTGLSVGDIIDLGKYHVDPELIPQLEKMGHTKVSVDQLVQMAKYGIDADYVCELHEAGVKASLEELIELGKHNVSPEFVRSMQKERN